MVLCVLCVSAVSSVSIRLIQKLRRVHDFGLEAGPLGSGFELEQAAGVTGEHDVGLGRGDVVQLAIENLGRALGMGDVVDSGAAAAPVRFLHLDELDPWNL